MCGSSKTACAPYKRTEKGRCRNVLRRPFFALRTGGCQGSDFSPEPRGIFEASGALGELCVASSALARRTGSAVYSCAAYKIAGQLVAYCIEHTAVLEELPLALLRQYSERFDEDVYAAIALTNCVTGRTSLGGTCVASVEAQIASVRDFLAGQTEAAKQAKNG